MIGMCAKMHLIVTDNRMLFRDDNLHSHQPNFLCFD